MPHPIRSLTVCIVKVIESHKMRPPPWPPPATSASRAMGCMLEAVDSAQTVKHASSIWQRCPAYMLPQRHTSQLQQVCMFRQAK